jgi:hypothetical protein
MKQVGGWLAGILAAIIGGYVLWILTRTPPAPPAPPPAVVTTFEGMVYSGDEPVPKAMVELDLTGTSSNGPVHDITDENGSYRFDFTGLPTTAGATLRVAAPGFRESPAKSFASPLQTEVRFDFPLASLLTAPLHGGTARQTPAPVAHLPVYIRKGAAQAMHIRIPAKQ